MIIIDTIKSFLGLLDRKEFIRYSSIYVGACFLVIVFLFVRYLFLFKDEQNKITQLNKSRRAVQEILTKFSQVEQQKIKVDTLLKKDKNFNIQKFFQDLSQKNGITSQVSQKFSQAKLSNGYTEESLQINLSAFDTKQLCDVLESIEAEPLIYAKSLDITKMSGARKINVILVIATLRAED